MQPITVRILFKRVSLFPNDGSFVINYLHFEMVDDTQSLTR